VRQLNESAIVTLLASKKIAQPALTAMLQHNPRLKNASDARAVDPTHFRSIHGYMPFLSLFPSPVQICLQEAFAAKKPPQYA
jgi:hypothetical protein